MPRTLSEHDDDDPMFENMVSNLPLLFAGGYPTSLDRITESQLEKFIPFLVQCSLGHIQIQHHAEYSEPEWWPEDVPFGIPLRRPPAISADNWHTTMKEIVVICYSFHKGIFLLRFCNELCSFQPEYLRFINNKDSTTSLYDRISNKLLVTFRNENMMYDLAQPSSAKKTLIPRQNSQSMVADNNGCQSIVEPALLDIYLCDHCEAELYSLDAYREHERNCKFDDDVIFCGADDSADSPNEESAIPEMLLKQSIFLQQFNLQNDLVPLAPPSASTKTPTKRTPEKLKRWPKRSRPGMLLAKCPTIPLSSPGGQRLLALSKVALPPEYLKERLDRTERFCHAPALGRVPSQHRLKFLERKPPLNPNISTTFRRPPNYHYHQYTFPRRQFSKRRRFESFLHLNWDELRRCQPVTINLRKLSLATLNNSPLDDTARGTTAQETQKRPAEYAAAHSASKETDFGRRSRPNPKRKQSHRAHNEYGTDTMSSTHTELVIDLCSSDDECARSPANNTKRRHIPAAHATHSPVANVSIHPINMCAVTDTPTTGGSSNSQRSSPAAGSQASPNHPSVLIISHLTQTSMTLDNHKKTYRFQNQENDFQQFVNNAAASSSPAGSACGLLEFASLPNSITLTAANHQHTHNSARFLPEVVLERIASGGGGGQAAPSQQLCIDLT